MLRTLSVCGLFLCAVPLQAQAPTVKKAEAAVRKFILANTDDPDSLKWVKFGPHDLKAAADAWAVDSRLTEEDLAHLNTSPGACYRKLLAAGARTPLPLARARYRLRNRAGALELHDLLFAVANGRAVPFRVNRNGDEWLPALRQYLEVVRKPRKVP